MWVMKLAVDKTPVGSPLRLLVTEDLVYDIEDTQDYNYSDLSIFDGSIGSTAELLRAMKENKLVVPDARLHKPELRRKYMVDSSP